MSKSVKNINTLQHAIGPFLLLAQFFGVMPVSGVWPNNDLEKVKFHWISLRHLVGLTLLSFCIFDCVVAAKVVLNSGLKIYTIGPLSFSAICIACFGVFLLLSHNWSLVVKETARCELVFQKKCYASKLGNQFSRRIRQWGIVLLLGAALEHCSYMGSAVYNNYRQINECKLNVDFWQNFFMRERQELFVVFKFSSWLIIFIEWTTVSMTFVWNFLDIFLTLVCRSLEIRFKQLHWLIKQHAMEHMPNEFWQQVRLDLLDLSDLLKFYDKQLSSLFLLACTHNMYFLVVQIYHSFQITGSFMDELYFWFSLLYVMARVLSMMFAASSIPHATNMISHTLYEIPTDYWCLELKRINEIITADAFALSGKGYFFITRRLIFAMVGTMMVYELVLINQMEGVEVEKSFCSGGSSKSPFS